MNSNPSKSSYSEVDNPSSNLPKQSQIKKKKKNHKKVHKMLSSTYKKKKCEFYNRGSCSKGAHCTFSHNFIPDVAKKICKFYLSGSCTKGEECLYSHNTQRYPCKFYHLQQTCKEGQNCRFSHSQIEEDFLEEYLKDNEDFLIKLIKEGKQIHEKYLKYVDKKDLLGNGKLEAPFIFGQQMIEKQNTEENEKIIPLKMQKIVKKQIQKKTLKKEQIIERYYESLQCFMHSYY